MAPRDTRQKPRTRAQTAGRKRGRQANVTPTTGLTGRQKGGPAAHKEATHHAKKSEEMSVRRQRAWRLFVDEQLTCQAIADQLGVSNYTIWHDLVAVDTALRAGGDLTHLELLRTRQASALDGIRATHWPKRATKANAEVLLDVLQQERRLYGLDRQQKDDRRYTQEQFDAVVVAIIRAALGIVTSVNQREQLRAAIGQISPLFLQAVPEAEPPLEQTG